MRKSGSIDISGCLSRSRQQCGRGQKFRVRFARDYLVYDPPYLMSWIRPWNGLYIIIFTYFGSSLLPCQAMKLSF